jgi:hypothetical protein
MQRAAYLSPQAGRARRDPGRAPAAAEQRNTADKTYSGNQAGLRRFSALQCKLAVGSVNDPLEAEADRAADLVMRMTDPNLSVSSGATQIVRKSSSREEEDEKPGLMRKPSANSPSPVTSAPAAVEEELRSSGQPLDPATRSMFEPRFGVDFSHVRIHAGDSAGRSAAQTGALAYTVGSHIVFGNGNFSPATMNGQKLLAHELAHVVQQGQLRPVQGRELGTGASARASQHPAPANGLAEQHSAIPEPALRKSASLGITASSCEFIARLSVPAQSLVDQVVQALSAADPIGGVGNPAAAFQTLAGIADDQLLLEVLTELGRRAQLDILISNVGSAPADSELLLSSLYAVKVATGGISDIADPYLIQAAQHIGQVPEARRDSILRYVVATRYGTQYLAATMEALPAMVAALRSAAVTQDAALQTAGAGGGALPSPGPWAPPGGQPIPFYIGNQAHTGIAAYYALAHPADVTFYNFIPMSNIVSRWTSMGNTLTGALAAGNADLKPDIANLTRRHLYEIKPLASVGLAVTEATMYAGLFTAVGIPMTLGPAGETGTTGVVPAPAGVYIFASPVPGAITYEYRRAQLEKVPVEEPSGARKWRIELRPLTVQQQQAIVATTAVGGMMLIIIMIALSPVGV